MTDTQVRTEADQFPDEVIPATKTLPLVKDPDRLTQRLKEIPLEPGVYFMRDAADRIMYIGKSRKLRSRVVSYFRGTEKLGDGEAGGRN